jgi:hypothetical protein
MDSLAVSDINADVRLEGNPLSKCGKRDVVLHESTDHHAWDQFKQSS